MIGFSIMMWFVSIILCIVSISLLKGNPAGMHGKVYETTKDRTGYAIASGKAVLVMGLGMIVCGCVALLGTTFEGIRNAMIVLAADIVIAAIMFTKIQRKYKEK